MNAIKPITLAVSALIVANFAYAKGKPTADSILPHKFTCSASLKFQAQDMTQQQFIDSCALVGAEEEYFHQRLETGYQPVDGDLNEDLLMVIFDNYRQYDRYGFRLFGINTNNGGMYIEGNAEDANNQATFYAHEADWLRPEFSIWNLEHEYVHYLDGRFDLKGNFSDYPENTVWWSEGLAEYISLKDANDDAIALVQGNFQDRTLSQVFNTNYSNSSDEIYRWGYLGARFMFENHMDQVRNIRLAARDGNWAEYQTILAQTAANNEQQWQNWLMALASN